MNTKENTDNGHKIHVEVNPVFHVVGGNAIANAQAQASATVQVSVQFSDLKSAFRNLKSELEDETALPKSVEKSLDEINHELDSVAVSDSPEKEEETRKALVTPLNKLANLITDMGKEDSKIHGFVNGLKKGKEMAQKIATYYNKLAPWAGLPSVPDVFL